MYQILPIETKISSNNLPDIGAKTTGEVPISMILLVINKASDSTAGLTVSSTPPVAFVNVFFDADNLPSFNLANVCGSFLSFSDFS